MCIFQESEAHTYIHTYMYAGIDYVPIGGEVLLSSGESIRNAVLSKEEKTVLIRTNASHVGTPKVLAHASLTMSSAGETGQNQYAVRTLTLGSTGCLRGGHAVL